MLFSLQGSQDPCTCIDSACGTNASTQQTLTECLPPSSAFPLLLLTARCEFRTRAGGTSNVRDVKLAIIQRNGFIFSAGDLRVSCRGRRWGCGISHVISGWKAPRHPGSSPPGEHVPLPEQWSPGPTPPSTRRLSTLLCRGWTGCYCSCTILTSAGGPQAPRWESPHCTGC